jgi:glycosyltransferase involved in cell wall biosynthesis
LRIGFVIPTLGPGGAERVATLLSNDWVGRGHTVDLVTFESGVTEPFHALAQGVRVHRLREQPTASGLLPRLWANVGRISQLRGLLRRLRPDVVVSFMTEANVIALAACRGLRLPVVISERNQPDRPGLGRARRLARRLTYGWAAGIVMQTEALAAWARARFKVPVHVIPNPVPINEAPRRREEDLENHAARLVVAIGRLTQQKGFDLLIESFGQIAPKYPDWRLIIYGDGPQRRELTLMAQGDLLQGRVALPGLTKDVAVALSQASIFVLPSRFEGFPNVLLEALSLGVPAIATECPGASAEILRDGTYGLLVPPDDVQAMKAALETMMTQPELRKAFAAKGPEAVHSYAIAQVSGRWLDLLRAIGNREARSE